MPQPMSDKPEEAAAPAPKDQAPEPRRYEQSGLYPENGKPFRLWALLGALLVVIALLAGVAALINIIVLPTL